MSALLAGSRFLLLQSAVRTAPPHAAPERRARALTPAPARRYCCGMRAVRWWRTIPPELLLLTALAFLTRCWRLSTPGARVWDEVYFEEYASRYFSGSYYFDVHPPLGKLLIALTAWLARVPGDQLAAGASMPQLRVLPALFGALLIPTFWWFLRELGARRKVAAFGAALLLLDNALLVQSRFVLTDILLLWFGLAAVTALLVARRSIAGARWRWLALAAVLAGAAVSTKWTGLTALGLIGLIWLVDARHASPRLPMARAAGEGALLVVLPAAVYCGVFAVHFALLPNDGPGVAVMSADFAATRRGNASYRDDAHIAFSEELADVHRAAMTTNVGWSHLAHVAASPWYTWPISKHRIMLWKQEAAPNGGEQRIDIQGNPVLWYGVLVAIATFVVALARKRVRAGRLRGALALLAAGYVMNFAPFALITRPMFLYHYYFALVYSVAFAALAVGLMAGWQDEDDAPWRFATARSRAVFVATLALVALSFVWFAPLSYGTALGADAAAQRRWVLERH